jgi:hypothetical protein
MKKRSIPKQLPLKIQMINETIVEYGGSISTIDEELKYMFYSELCNFFSISLSASREYVLLVTANHCVNWKSNPEIKSAMWFITIMLILNVIHMCFFVKFFYSILFIPFTGLLIICLWFFNNVFVWAIIIFFYLLCLFFYKNYFKSLFTLTRNFEDEEEDRNEIFRRKNFIKRLSFLHYILIFALSFFLFLYSHLF